ncbi:gp55 [Alphaproteobacteria phage PhiJL001]|uniref:Gp55 n=1 Tax=Alphaproteobacteria phage PhiJL001 TaxID=2681607 RepID=Q5DN50_9CAUD|nr:gp55 [Alphaproteobacteria phage PhiJL001]AAT69531.1 gp55 [Alphaproteobacteria phage PhiJL001]
MSQASPYNARPNKRWGWGPVGGMGRFGGGWEFCLGVRAGSWTSWYLELGLGMVRLSTHPPHSFKELRR